MKRVNINEDGVVALGPLVIFILFIISILNILLPFIKKGIAIFLSIILEFIVFIGLIEFWFHYLSFLYPSGYEDEIIGHAVGYAILLIIPFHLFFFMLSKIVKALRRSPWDNAVFITTNDDIFEKDKPFLDERGPLN